MTISSPNCLAIQLTNFSAGVQAWDSAVAINRNNQDNIVVSYGLIDFNNFTFPPCRAVSFDGGKTWGNGSPYVYTAFVGSIAGNILTVTDMLAGSLSVGDILYTDEAFPPLTGIVPGTVITGFQTGTGGVGTYTVNIVQTVQSVLIVAGQPLNGPIQIVAGYSGGFGDARGVSADKFGNIWYGSSSAFDALGNTPYEPLFAASSDGGVTFEVVYTLPAPPDLILDQYDYPQYCFGGDGLGNYGLWFQASIFNQVAATGDAYPTVGFIPITGLGSFGTPSFTALPGFTNAQLESDLTASADGRLWLHSGPWIGGQGPNASPYTYIQPSTFVFKSPGAQDVNYAGPWNFNSSNANFVSIFWTFLS